jgi:choline dehydrogenase-like flavoprotein
MYAHVTKVVINPITKQATGVQFLRDGRIHLVHAKREVILSAGTIGSAQLLMLSGVGPGEHLQRLGIPVLQNLRVGDNLQDHVGMFGLTFIVDKPVAIIQNRLRVCLFSSISLQHFNVFDIKVV